MTMIPEATVTAELIASRFKLTPDEGARVRDLALAELGRATEEVWRPVPATVWDDWIVRVCGQIVAAKKTPTAGAPQATQADQGVPRVPGAGREYLGPIRSELNLYVNLGIA